MSTKPRQTPAADQQVLARILKEAVKSGKYTFGTKEVLSEIKTSKLILVAGDHASRTPGEMRITEEAQKNRVPVVTTARSSAQLGRMIGRPFRVSAIALRAVAEGDFRALVGSLQPKASE